MSAPQPGILDDLPPHSRYLEFSLHPDCDPAPALRALAARGSDGGVVVGFGAGLVARMGAGVAPLRTFPAMSGPGCEIPSTQSDIWCWVRGEDRGTIMHMGRAIEETLSSAFSLSHIVDGFVHDGGRDLSGYEDGTENPAGADAVNAAIAQGLDGGLDGSSFVAVQQWAHDLEHFETLQQDDRDNIIGRRLRDNEELDDAPISAHVKRTAQESFDPEAFILRRSMAWADAGGEGLMFTAFGASFDAFKAQLKRMAGHEDGILDGLFRFTRPLTGGYYWCPPIKDGTLDLAAMGL